MENDKSPLENLHNYNINTINREIYLQSYSDHEEDPGIDYRTLNYFLKNLYYLDRQRKDILIHLNTIGGDLYHGMGIYDAIKNTQSHITILCHGSVLSMGIIILQAADSRISMPNCTFMAHLGSAGSSESYRANLSWTEYSKKIMNKQNDILAQKCLSGEHFKKSTKAKVKNYISTKFNNYEDWILDAKDAKYYGFIDKIIDEDINIKDVY